ncbi:TPA: hypothetical protein ACGCEE_000278 [Stenotrophomonas maltophilia]
MSQVSQPRTGGRNMAASVEAPRRTGTTGSAFRQQWKPQAMCVVDAKRPIDAVAKIIPRILENKRACTASSYLLIDPATSRAFVLPEDKAAAVEMARLGPRSPYWPWIVGLYRFSKADDLAMAAEALLEDIRDHLGIPQPAPKPVSLQVQLDLFGMPELAA